LDLSRLAASHYVAERQLFALDRLLEDVCAEYQSAALGKGLVLRHALTPATLRSDAMAVARIARNLLDNAIKYTESGEILLALRTDGEEAVISVVDTGRGIPPDDVPRVFEEFYQVGNQSRYRSQGVGLGLAIVKRLGELLGGSISLTSRPGEGTRFELRVPGLEAASVLPELLPERVESLPMPVEGGRVFIVDDEADILTSMTVLLRLWALEVHTAADAAEADALFARLGVPDLLITDLRLRGPEHGAELAARLARMHGDFRTVIITGETSSQALVEAQAAGHAVLQKPVDAQLLRIAVHAALTEGAPVEA
jgi:CheY-like chemotaxis protein/two-component sensor histidine kinase